MNHKAASYALTFIESAGYLYARVEADTISVDTALEYLTEIAKRCEETHSKKLLIERNISTMLNTTDLVYTTKEFLKMIRRTKVAFVNEHECIHDEMHFAITVGTNRGANYRLFSGFSEAEKWLIGDKA